MDVSIRDEMLRLFKICHDIEHGRCRKNRSIAEGRLVTLITSDKGAAVFREMVHTNGYRRWIPQNSGTSFLQWACLAKCGPPIFRAMLDAAPSQEWEGILHYAAKQHVAQDVMKVLVQKYPGELNHRVDNETPLHVAIEENQQHLISVLMNDSVKEALSSAHYPIRNSQDLTKAYSIARIYRESIFPSSSLMMLVVPTEENDQEYGCFQLLGKCRCCRNSMVMVFAMKIQPQTNWLDMMIKVDPDNLHVRDLALQEECIGTDVSMLDDATFTDCQMTDQALSKFANTMSGLKALALASPKGLKALNIPLTIEEVRISHCRHLLQSESFLRLLKDPQSQMKGLYLEESSRQVCSSVLQLLRKNRKLERMGLRMANHADMISLLDETLLVVKEHNTSLQKFKVSLVDQDTKPQALLDLEEELKSWMAFNHAGRSKLRKMNKSDFVDELFGKAESWTPSTIFLALREYPDQWSRF